MAELIVGEIRSPLPGQRLREIRDRLGLTLKEVETRSREIAAQRQNSDYLFTAGRLSQVENSSSVPSAYKLATLSEIYRRPYGELLRLYGVETTEEAGPDQASESESPKGPSRGS